MEHLSSGGPSVEGIEGVGSLSLLIFPFYYFVDLLEVGAAREVLVSYPRPPPLSLLLVVSVQY